MRYSFLSLIGAGAFAALGCNDTNGFGAAPPEQIGMAAAKQTSKSVFATPTTRAPITMDLPGMKAMLGTPHFETMSHLSPTAASDVRSHRAQSVPTFSRSFTLAGTTFPYTMVGGDPTEGGETDVKNTILPVSFIFDEFADALGNPLFVDATPFVQPLVTSPDFVKAQYGTGFTQFSDAIQRAEFFHIMGKDWHTLFATPRVQKGITMEVPVGAAQVFQVPDGTIVTLLDPNFFFSQLTTITQLADFHARELAILFTPNMFLPVGGGGVVLGFHTAFDASDPLLNPVDGQPIQTFAWASWIDPTLFGGVIQDVTAISHELAEFTNDPFGNNTTENWAFPGTVPGTACQNNLETGDPVEVLANPTFPVTLHGFTYHPQTEALLQWFTQEVPSSAFHGAYSYPDTTALPVPSVTCP